MPDHAASLPDEFLAEMRALEESYLAQDDPIRRSGYGGHSREGPPASRWPLPSVLR